MPAYSTLDLIYEVYEAIGSLSGFQFSLDELARKINQNRKRRNEKRKVSKDSVNRILNKLWLILNISKISGEKWEKGTSPMRGLTKVRPDIVEKVIQRQEIDATPSNIDFWIGLGELNTSHRAYICYPYRNNPLKHSLELLVLLIHLYPKVKDSYTPATPHEMYWGLEERRNREIAMSECEKLIEKCDFMLICQRKGETPSKGMQKDIQIARAKNMPIKYIEDILGYYPDVDTIMLNSGLVEFVAVSEEPQPVLSVAISNSSSSNR